MIDNSVVRFLLHSYVSFVFTGSGGGGAVNDGGIDSNLVKGKN